MDALLIATVIPAGAVPDAVARVIQLLDAVALHAIPATELVKLTCAFDVSPAASEKLS
jgi:hypothetical protein